MLQMEVSLLCGTFTVSNANIYIAYLLFVLKFKNYSAEYK